MTKVNYSQSSPYSSTPQVNYLLEYLDYWNGYYVFPSDSDSLYTVEKRYEHRPDLLSFDMYGSPRYWWIFALRNPDQLKDPIYDLKAGMVISLPAKSALPGIPR